jgi:hypothetical protein
MTTPKLPRVSASLPPPQMAYLAALAKTWGVSKSAAIARVLVEKEQALKGTKR